MEDATAALPDDLVLEVLVRVEDVAALFRCAMACRRWRGLITDRSFLRSRWPENATHPSFLVGFFTQRLWCPGSEHVAEYPIAQDEMDPDSPPVFIPAPHSVLACGLRLSSAGLLRGARPLTARCGVLVVLLGPIISSGPIRLAVCDLLAGTCDLLPPLQCGREWTPTSYAILTGEDCHSSDGQKPLSPAPDYSRFFKVVVIVIVRQIYGDLDYNVHVFSSAEPGWATPAKLAAPGFWTYVQHEAAVCRRGMAHWLSGDWYPGGPTNILTVDSSSGGCHAHASLVELSLPAIQPTPGTYDVATIDGTLSLFCLRTEKEDLKVEIWAWRDDGTGLYLARVIELKPPENKALHEASCWWSGEKSGTLLIRDSSLCTDSSLCMGTYIAYLQTGEMEELSNQFSGTVGSVAPIEIDWPTLFMSRLVGG